MVGIGIWIGVATDTYGGVRGPSAPDVTAPTLSAASALATGGSTASISVSTDEANGDLSFVASTSIIKPTPEQVEAGQIHTGAAAPDSGVQPVVSFGQQIIIGGAAGLASETTYYFHLVQRDTAGNIGDVVTTNPITTADVTGPTIELPVDVPTGATTGYGSFSTDTAEDEAAVVLSYYLQAPTAEQIFAGVQYDGSPALYAAQQLVTTTGLQEFTFTGLETDVFQVAHYAQRDTAGNYSNVISGDGFTPTVDVPPIQSYFGNRYFGLRYFGERYFTVNVTADYFANKYFGRRYFGNRYFAVITDTVQENDDDELLLFF